MMPADDWVTSAMSNDTAVVDLLFRLKQSSEAFTVVQFPLPQSMEHKLLFVGWGNRKLRSTAARKEQTESARGSPTTPLSWSGGGVLASDSYDESSDVHSVNRSKSASNNDHASSSSNKRSRKNKTFAQLQEEENLQLKESVYLNKNDITIQSTEEKTVEAFAFGCRIDGHQNRDRNFILPDLNMEPTDEEEYPGFAISVNS